MDTEQIRREMSVKRAAIDHKLDRLALRTSEAKREAKRGTAAIAAAWVVATGIAWLWRKRRIRRARRMLRETVT